MEKRFASGGERWKVDPDEQRNYEAVDEVMEPILEGDVAAVRRRQEERLMTLVEEAVKMRYFDFPYILWFLMRCEAEARDLVRIAWGIDQKLPYELFSRYLLLI